MQAPPEIAAQLPEGDILAGNDNYRSRDGFQMAVGWMRADFARPDRRLKAPEEGKRGQQGYAMEIKREGSGVVWRLRCVLLRRQGRCWR